MDLVAAAAKLGQNVGRQKFRVAACRINVGIGFAQQRIEHFVKALEHLYFVEQNVVHASVGHLSLEVREKHKGIAQAGVFEAIAFNDQNVAVGDARGQKVLAKER